MIDKLNLIILKIIFLKKINEKVYKITPKASNICINSSENLKINLKVFYENLSNSYVPCKNNFNWLKINNRIIASLYLMFFIYFSFYKNKIIKYNKNYLNFFLKNKNIFSLSIYNFYIKNTLFFYKFFNKQYLVKFTKLKGRMQKKNLFFRLKKKKELINPSFFMNFKKDLIVSKNFKKKLSSLNLTITNCYEDFFFPKCSSNQNINLKNCSHKASEIINLLSTFRKKNFQKKILKKKRMKFKKKNFGFFNNLSKTFNRIFIYNFSKNKKAKPFQFDLSIFNNFTNFYRFYNCLNFFVLEKFNIYKNFNFLYISYSRLFFIKFKKHKKKNILKKLRKIKFNYFNKYIFNIFKNVIYLNDFYSNNHFFNNELTSLINNSYLYKHLNILSDTNIPPKALNTSEDSLTSKNSFFLYNNYYPVFYANKYTQNRFFLKFKFNLNISYLSYMQFYILSFLENMFKKKFFIKATNNFFQKPGYTKYLDLIYSNYKNFQPKYMKNFLIRDFLEIVWYSFFLKDLTLLSDWVSKFMESSHFKTHKRFLVFFQNFIHKYSSIFMDILQIRGFFFDIRGKVGVTGNSKKRHFFFKMGELNKSTKIKKINFNQSVVRTPSGALGLTFLINY